MPPNHDAPPRLRMDEWEGASLKVYQSKRRVPVADATASFNPAAGPDGERPGSYAAGNSSKFVGLRRARADDHVGARRARDDAVADRFYARDAARGAALVAARERSGFDAVTGAEVAPERDGFRARGRV